MYIIIVYGWRGGRILILIFLMHNPHDILYRLDNIIWNKNKKWKNIPLVCSHAMPTIIFAIIICEDYSWNLKIIWVLSPISEYYYYKTWELEF